MYCTRERATVRSDIAYGYRNQEPDTTESYHAGGEIPDHVPDNNQTRVKTEPVAGRAVTEIADRNPTRERIDTVY